MHCEYSLIKRKVYESSVSDESYTYCLNKFLNHVYKSYYSTIFILEIKVISSHPTPTKYSSGSGFVLEDSHPYPLPLPIQTPLNYQQQKQNSSSKSLYARPSPLSRHQLTSWGLNQAAIVLSQLEHRGATLRWTRFLAKKSSPASLFCRTWSVKAQTRSPNIGLWEL